MANILVLSGEEDILRVLIGVAGCVAMPSTPDDLIEARDVILAGGTYYPSLE
jgi:DNA-binding NarL/FixJ family response regulator